MTDTACWQAPIAAPCPQHRERALARQARLTKPPGSLGRLEGVAVELAALQASDRPDLDAVAITVFAADHGVCAEGVSAFPQAVTGQMIANFVTGGAAISVLARHLDARLEVVNLGTVAPPPVSDGVVDETIAPGTDNLAVRPAMSPEQLDAALAAGDRAAARAAEAGARLFVGGEMGIGNTTSASAVACALLGKPARSLTGPGTGLDRYGVGRKVAVIERALRRHADPRDPLQALASVGGFEIAALAGAFIGAAARGLVVLVDGFIVTVAALAAVRLRPELRPWLVFSHQSAEPGHVRLLQTLEAEPLLCLDLRLGEGSGAALAVPLLRQACALHNEMATFEDAGVQDRS
ncbi:MAG: nicotinate-nucleotide--dimethylbenzimidazole phosphoribosyltransferase [Alcanivorax sp.]|uniref:Nicotinate-nucleotide--dimethylbenzimidazole phosphoribosyltransferase n=2 Tax=Alloalcanivorax marinus TaxID=1177169 RepID=A0A9Q3UL21_9GAMM|nr:nicotinate-nucleotide--dimethylbenzimidazole phosphoribosyltransferase [Alloalcanivorax marinus]MCC4308952.1 nicotinate-nucleotide--dimethylbenzimidazole phosphoribosyltransferase [Alloalcanivorax marinus]